MILEVILQGVGLGQANADRALRIVEPGKIFDRAGAGQHLRGLILLDQHGFQSFANGVVTAAALAGADHDGRVGGLRQGGGEQEGARPCEPEAHIHFSW